MLLQGFIAPTTSQFSRYCCTHNSISNSKVTAQTCVKLQQFCTAPLIEEPQPRFKLTIYGNIFCRLSTCQLCWVLSPHTTNSANCCWFTCMTKSPTIHALKQLAVCIWGNCCKFRVKFHGTCEAKFSMRFTDSRSINTRKF